MKVAELRSLLAERGLEESGKKADLVERLKEAMASDLEKEIMIDKHKKDNSKEGSVNGKNGSEGEEESEESEDGEDEDASNGRGDVSLPKKTGEGPLNDDKDFKSIGSQEFVAKKPEGVSFGLHTPKIKRPQLNLPVPPVEAPVEVSSYITSIFTSNVTERRKKGLFDGQTDR